VKALILYSSRDGQTRSIASYIANKLQDTLRCDVIDLLQAGNIDLTQYQQVLIGASVRYGHFHPTLGKFVKRHAEQLNRMPSAFFSVNLTARKADKRSPADQCLYPQVPAGVALAAKTVRRVCRRTALSTLSLARSRNDSTYYAYDRWRNRQQ
jgi:hypothetical protein